MRPEDYVLRREFTDAQIAWKTGRPQWKALLKAIRSDSPEPEIIAAGKLAGATLSELQQLLYQRSCNRENGGSTVAFKRLDAERNKLQAELAVLEEKRDDAPTLGEARVFEKEVSKARDRLNTLQGAWSAASNESHFYRAAQEAGVV